MGTSKPIHCEVETLPLALPCICMGDLNSASCSCLGSSVGKRFSQNAEGSGFESHPRQLIVLHK